MSELIHRFWYVYLPLLLVCGFVMTLPTFHASSAFLVDRIRNRPRWWAGGFVITGVGMLLTTVVRLGGHFNILFVVMALLMAVCVGGYLLSTSSSDATLPPKPYISDIVVALLMALCIALVMGSTLTELVAMSQANQQEADTRVNHRLIEYGLAPLIKYGERHDLTASIGGRHMVSIVYAPSSDRELRCPFASFAAEFNHDGSLRWFRATIVQHSGHRHNFRTGDAPIDVVTAVVKYCQRNP